MMWFYWLDIQNIDILIFDMLEYFSISFRWLSINNSMMCFYCEKTSPAITNKPAGFDLPTSPKINLFNLS